MHDVERPYTFLLCQELLHIRNVRFATSNTSPTFRKFSSRDKYKQSNSRCSGREPMRRIVLPLSKNVLLNRGSCSAVCSWKVTEFFCVLTPRYVLSSRVRTGRAIRGIPHPPVCSRAERREVERVVTDALKGLPHDLAGRYFSLTTMTDEEQNQLIEVGTVLVVQLARRAVGVWYNLRIFKTSFRCRTISCSTSPFRLCWRQPAWQGTGLTHVASSTT